MTILGLLVQQLGEAQSKPVKEQITSRTAQTRPLKKVKK
jgi:hypothetical protein